MRSRSSGSVWRDRAAAQVQFEPALGGDGRLTGDQTLEACLQVEGIAAPGAQTSRVANVQQAAEQAVHGLGRGVMRSRICRLPASRLVLGELGYEQPERMQRPAQVVAGGGEEARQRCWRVRPRRDVRAIGGRLFDLARHRCVRGAQAPGHLVHALGQDAQRATADHRDTAVEFAAADAEHGVPRCCGSGR